MLRPPSGRTRSTRSNPSPVMTSIPFPEIPITVPGVPGISPSPLSTSAFSIPTRPPVPGRHKSGRKTVHVPGHGSNARTRRSIRSAGSRQSIKPSPFTSLNTTLASDGSCAVATNGSPAAKRRIRHTSDAAPTIASRSVTSPAVSVKVIGSIRRTRIGPSSMPALI